MANRNIEFRVYDTDGVPYTTSGTPPTTRLRYFGDQTYTPDVSYIDDGLWGLVVDDTKDCVVYWSGVNILADHLTILKIPTVPSNIKLVNDVAVNNINDFKATGFSVAGDAMTLTLAERTAIANEVESQIIDDTDDEKVLEAIVNKIWSLNPDFDDLTLAGIRSAIRTELSAELSRIDANISSRAVPSDLLVPDYDGLVDAINILTSSGFVIIGQGIGSTHYTNSVDFGPNRPKKDILVKAYSTVNNVTDFSQIKGMDVTDISGVFDLWLDPGDYILRFEKDGIGIDTVEITVGD